MRSSVRTSLSILAALVLVALAVASFVSASPTNVEAAPAAAPTPVSSVNRADPGQYFMFFNGEDLSTDTTSDCFELGAYNLADLYYNIDVTDPATVTLYLKFGNTDSALVNSIAVRSGITTDVAAMQQVQLFGRYACAYATVVSTSTVELTVDAWAK